MPAISSALSIAVRPRDHAANLARANQQPRPRLACVRPHEPRQCGGEIALERALRQPSDGGQGDLGRIVARRWKEDADTSRAETSAPDRRFALVSIALRATAGKLVVDGETVHDGPVPTGFAWLTRPGVRGSARFSGPRDILQLFVPSGRLAEIASSAGTPTGLAPEPDWLGASDPLIERLSWLLLKGAGDAGLASSTLYLDGIAVAIVSRLLGRGEGDANRSRGLVKWRLKRVQQLVEEQLSEPLALTDLARCAGLSRMHFAAQFRAATGMRPHEYLVRRRIQRAQEILLTTGMPLVEVALAVGFQTQAHFTTVFRRFLGETPGRWREAQRQVP